MTVNSPLSVPRLAFLGFCERAEEITKGYPLLWQWNLLGVSTSLAFYVFPTNLRGHRLVLAVYQPKAGDRFKLSFRGTQGQAPFDVEIQITGFACTNVNGSVIEQTEYNAGLASEGWALLANPLNVDIVVNSPGTYDVYLVSGSAEQYVGTAVLAHVTVPPYTPEEITAIKSDPLAMKSVRINLTCNSCHDVFKAYAGLERLGALEQQGYQWNQDITEDEFVCSCEKMRVGLTPIRTGLHGLLRRNMARSETGLSVVRLYERTALEQYSRELLKLISKKTDEEVLQKFLESHPIFFHIFVPKKVIFKPPILTRFFADFAVLNARDELLLIEIEKPHLRLLKKDGDITAGLEHAFYQVRTWKQVLDDHRAAALEAMGLELNEVAKIKSVVVAGRKPSNDKKLRMLRAVSNAEIELFTYDDLLASITELIRQVANV